MPTLDPKKYGLAFHTTTPQLGLAISNFAGDTRSQTWDLGRDTSSYLHQYLIEFMQPQIWDDIEFVAVAKGPGGFTGTRIGVVTARTIAQQLNIPVFAVSTLAAIAHSEKEKYNPNTLLAVQMDARRDQLFVAIYELGGDRLYLKEYLPDTTMTLSAWQQTLDSLKVTYNLINAPVSIGHTVSNLLELAYRKCLEGKRPQWSEALPFYGQHPVEI